MGQFGKFFQTTCTVLHVQRFCPETNGSHHAEMEVHFLGSKSVLHSSASTT